MTSDETLAELDEAIAAHIRAQRGAKTAKHRLFAACTKAAKEGSSPEALAARMERMLDLMGGPMSGDNPGLTFTAAYVRREVRKRGATALPPGPKPRPASSEEKTT